METMHVANNVPLFSVLVDPEIAGENDAKVARKWTATSPRGNCSAVRTARARLRLVTHGTATSGVKEEEEGAVITLASEIIDFAFSQCGGFLAAADASGVLRLFKRESAQELFAYPIIAPTVTASDSIQAIAFALQPAVAKDAPEDDVELREDLLVLTNAGTLIRLGNLHLAEIERTLARESSQNVALRTIMASIQLQQVNVGKRRDGAKSILLGRRYPSSLFVVVANHEDSLSVWGVGTRGLKRDGTIKRLAAFGALMDGTNALDAQFALNGRCLAVLSENGALTWWDWRGLLLLHEMQISNIKAFVVLDSQINDLSSDVSCTVALSCQTPEKSASTTIQLVQVHHLLSSQSSDAVSTLVVPIEPAVTLMNIATHQLMTGEPGLLVTLSGSDTVRALVLGLHNQNDEVDQVETMRDEPFATSVGVRCGQELRALDISSLSDMRTVIDLEEKVKRWLSCIGKELEDSRIIVESLVEFAKRLRLAQASPDSLSPTLAKHLPSWLDQIASISYRWTTFTLLLSTVVNTDSQSLATRWQEFCKANLLDVMRYYLKHGMMRAASLLWQRHTHEDSLHHIDSILEALPQDLSFSAYENWLQGDVVPGIVRYVERQAIFSSSSDAETINNFASWMVKRIEYFAEKDDIDTALKLCHLLKPTSESSAGLSSQISTRWVSLKLLASSTDLQSEGTRITPLDCIERLARQLTDLKHLEAQHGFKISLAAYVQETPVSIAMSMLDRCASAEMVPVEVQQHIMPYLSHTGQGKDSVLLDYVTEVLESSPTTTNSSEQVRLIAVIEQIADVEVRTSAALLFFGSLLPPFSSHVKQFTRKCITWDTRQIDVIQEHVRLMDIQDMLTSYGVARFQVGDARGGSRLVSHILAQVARESAFADALQLVSAYSHLSTERAALEYFENILTIEAPSFGLSVEGVALRRSGLMKSAIKQLKTHYASLGTTWKVVSVLEETVALGIYLLEMKEADQEAKNVRRPSQSMSAPLGDELFLRVLEESVEVFITETDGIEAPAGADDKWGSSDGESCDLISVKLLSDVQRIRTLHNEWGIIMSVKTLRDRERVSERVRAFIEPEAMFSGVKMDQAVTKPVNFLPVGKGKKRALGASNAGDVGGAAKRARSVATTGFTIHENDDQQDDRQTKVAFDVHRYATHLGMTGDDFHSIVAQAAAEHGDIIKAVQYSRDLFARRRGIAPVSSNGGSVAVINSSGLALKNISLSISKYTATHTEEIYSLAAQGHGLERQTLAPIQVARMQAPLYSLELLRYAMCVCDASSFEETFLLLKSAMMLNEILKFTQLGSIRGSQKLNEDKERIYDRWFREENLCMLPSAQTMNLATRFAIGEHRLLITHGDSVPVGVLDASASITSHDLLASKRFVSFLVENNADLLSLQVILSMLWISEDAISAIQTQVHKLITTVLQSRNIDSFLALGLMLKMDFMEAFHAFRDQWSRENVAKDFNRFQQLAKIGLDTARAFQEHAFLAQCVALEGNSRWLHVLNLLEIECDQKLFQGKHRDLNYIRSLVPTLLAKSSYDYYTIQEFTRHFQIEESYPALVYVEALLTVPEATAKGLEYQDKIVGVLEDIHEHKLVALLLKTLPKISGTDYDRLLFMFQLLLEHTSYAEKDEVERRIEVLRVLKAYAASEHGFQSGAEAASRDCKRDFARTDAEHDAETIGRVCFHRIMTKPREVLSRILTTRSFTILSNLDYPLRLGPDELLMMLLKNVVGKHQAEASKYLKKGLEMTPSMSGSELERLFGILTSLKATESKITAGEWLAEHLPVSTHKLRSLEFALDAAATSSRESVTHARPTPGNTTFMGIEALTRLEEKLLRSKVQLIFAESRSKIFVDVAVETRLLELISKHPQEAFYELYRAADAYVTSTSKEIAGHDEVHKIADRVAGVLSLRANELRIALIRELLIKDAVYIKQRHKQESTRGQQGEVQEIVFTPLEEQRRDSRDEVLINKITSIAGYVASASHSTSDATALVEYLVKLAQGTIPNLLATFRTKLRAARVALHLAQSHRSVVAAAVEAAKKLGEFDAVIKQLVVFIRHCKHMIVFEENHVPYEIGFVLRAQKEGLVRSLMRQHSGRESWVLRCAANLMLDFDVKALDLWEFVLATMADLKMFRSLSRVLNDLSQHDFVRSISGASAIWEATLLSPLAHLKYLSGNSLVTSMDVDDFGSSKTAEISEFHGIPLDSIRTELELMVGMLQKCPFLEQIDVASFVIHIRDINVSNVSSSLSGIDLFAYAVRCAMVIPRPSARMQALQRIIQSGAYVQVLTLVCDASVLNEETLDKTGDDSSARLFSDYVTEQLAILETVFKEVLKRNEHENLLGSPFEQGFLEFLALFGSIDRALAILLTEKRLEAASTLVEHYYESNPERAPEGWSVTEPPNGGTGGRWSTLQRYVAASTSSHLATYRQMTG